MSSPWTPDVPIDDETAQRLISSRFPELQPFKLRLLGSGWDNHAYLVNDAFVVRIPHRKLGGELMDIECRVLAHLTIHPLPLSIPSPCYTAPADDTFPYVIAGYPLIQGVTADTVSWTDYERAINAEPLGRFLAALHTVPIGLDSPPTDHLRRADLTYRLPNVLERLQPDLPEFRELLEDLALTPAHSKPPVWIHGDLYARHLVVDALREVRGVIDWGDSHVGDPALDLAIAWMFLPQEAHPAFIAAYGGVDQNSWRRARFRAMTHWAYIRPYAIERADESLLREAEFVYKNVMAE